MKKELVTDIKQVHPGDLIIVKSYYSLTDFMPVDSIGKTNVFYVLVSGNNYLDCIRTYRIKAVSYVDYFDIPITYPLQREYIIAGVEFNSNVVYKLDKSNLHYQSITQLFQLFMVTTFNEINTTLTGLNYNQRFIWNTNEKVEKCIKEYKENLGGKEWLEVGGYEISKYLLAKVL